MPGVPASFDAVHIGARVVVRWRLDPVPDSTVGSPSMTDTVGELVARSDTDVTVAMHDKPSQALRRGRKKSSMWFAIDAVKEFEPVPGE